MDPSFLKSRDALHEANLDLEVVCIVFLTNSSEFRRLVLKERNHEFQKIYFKRGNEQSLCCFVVCRISVAVLELLLQLKIVQPSAINHLKRNSGLIFFRV